MKIDEIRQIRNLRLIETDWTQIPDNSLTLEQKELWRIYRQSLRDITNSISDSDFEEDSFGNRYFMGWPTPPE